MENTVVGKRFEEFINSGQGHIVWAAESNIRYEMYVAGIEMFMDHPLAGVGLGHFVLFFPTGHYSHSDYIEPLATTGGIGFLLYQGFYIVLLLRLRRLLRIVRGIDERYLLQAMALTVFGFLLLGIGGPHWNSHITFILLTTFTSYTWILEHQLNRNAMEFSRNITGRSGAGGIKVRG
jgi:O-antigen ligase